MLDTSLAELESLRQGLTDNQRAVINATWTHYRDHGGWIPCRALHHLFGETAVLACLEQLRPNIILGMEEDEVEYYRLTFLGVLLTAQGEESEQLLAQYLEYVRGRFTDDPRLEWVGSQEVESALKLTPDRSQILRQLIRLSHWWGGGSGFGDQEWTVGVPIDVEEIPPGPDLRGYIRQHVLAHFHTQEPSPPAAKPRREFWFIEDSALQRQLTMDWREAQDAYQMRGWKSCVTLCGGILEAVLLGVLPAECHSPLPNSQNLSALVEAAGAQGILVKETAPLNPALLEFSHLIHPGLFPAGRIELTQEDAEAALIAVRVCLRQISAWRSKN